MTKPDECTSLDCISFGGDYCPKCSHALYFGEGYVGQRLWKWEFSPMFGPNFYMADGQTIRYRQPGERHPVWSVWEQWYEEVNHGRNHGTK